MEKQMQWKSQLESLRKERITSAQLRNCIETLIKINRNGLNDVKYRKIRTSNSTFRNSVWKYCQCQAFILSSGWKVTYDEEADEKPQVIQLHDKELAKNAINILLDYRMVQPNEKEWIEDTKKEQLRLVDQENKELRAKAALEREAECAKLKQDKLERLQLAEQIKQEQTDDRAYRNIRRVVPIKKIKVEH